MSARNAARRYANALFAVSREQDAVEPVRADLEHLVGLLETSKEWRLFVTEPSGSKTARARAIRELLEDRTHALTVRFVGFLDHKNRINLLALIFEEWMGLYDRHLGLLRATVTSATPLFEAQLKVLTERLAGRFGRKMLITARVDASLIGGLRIVTGDQVFDFSIESQLQHLQKRLTYA